MFEAGEPDRLRPGSRAIFVHRESVVILDRYHPGLGAVLIDHGLVWPTKRTVYRGREVFRRTYPPPPPGTIPQFTSLPQIETERYLRAACDERGVDFRWSTEVEGVDVEGDRVRVRAVDGTVTSAPYVIAADGARSAVRKSLGIEMEGSRSEGHYIVVDVAEDPEAPLPIDRVFHYEHPGIDHRNVLLVPFAGGWRVDLQLEEDDDPEEFASRTGSGAGYRVMDAKYADRLGWVSSYQFLQIVARSFCDPSGRVLLVGEAAHLFAPFGARGMNSGVADADAAATAVHLALDATNHAGRAFAAVADFARTRPAGRRVQPGRRRLGPHPPAAFGRPTGQTAVSRPPRADRARRGANGSSEPRTVPAPAAAAARAATDWTAIARGHEMASGVDLEGEVLVHRTDRR